MNSLDLTHRHAGAVDPAPNDAFGATQPVPAFEEQMEAARKIMKRRRNALRELAK